MTQGWCEMNRDVGKNEMQDDRASPPVFQKRGVRDADVLLLLSEAFKSRANEIDSLLDLSLSLLSTASDFPQKNDLEGSLKKALLIIRDFA